MRDEIEERGQQDQRDLEFYRQRVRPKISSLFRTNALSWKNNRISISVDKVNERDRGRQNLQTADWFAELLSDGRVGTDAEGASNSDGPGLKAARSEAVWSLVAAAIVLVLIGWSGDIDRVMAALAF